MYFPGTILELKQPRSVAPVKEDKAKNIKAVKGEVFAYDRVEVVGQSPVSHGGGGGWEGIDAQGVILKPITAFGGLIDEPHGKVLELYTVVSEPEQGPTDMTPQHVKVGPSPEDVFKREAGGAPKSATRVKTPHSPL